MCVHLEDYKVSYFAVPKCACTSLKSLFFEVENGFAWRKFRANGKWFWVHNVYPSLPFDAARRLVGADHWKFAVIRNPVERMVSVYRNRLMRGRGQQQLQDRAGDLNDRGLSPKPDFATFVCEYETYCDMSPDVKGHSRPLSYFLGRDAGYFDRLFRLGELADLMAELASRIPGLPALAHLQTRGRDIPVGDITAATRDRIRELFEEDYRLFGAQF